MVRVASYVGKRFYLSSFLPEMLACELAVDAV